jgi:hypothetical protein
MKEIVAVIMIAVTAQYQSEPRTVMAMWACALLTASSANVVRIMFVNRQDAKSLLLTWRASLPILAISSIQKSKSRESLRVVSEEVWTRNPVEAPQEYIVHSSCSAPAHWACWYDDVVKACF